MGSSSVFLFAASTILVACLGCGGGDRRAPRAATAAAEPEPVRSKIPSSPREASFAGGALGELFVSESSLVLTVPNPPSWRVRGRSGSWTELEHESGARLSVRVERAARNVTPAACAAAAQTSLRALREPGDEVLVERKTRDASSYGEVRIELLAGDRGRVVSHFVEPGRCVDLVFTSPAAFDLADRLELVARATAPSLRRTSVDERARSGDGPRD